MRQLKLFNDLILTPRAEPEEANELFCLQGHSLEPVHGLFDAIVVDALQCGDDIFTFYETCAEFGIKI